MMSVERQGEVEEVHDRSLVPGSRFSCDELYLRYESILLIMNFIRGIKCWLVKSLKVNINNSVRPKYMEQIIFFKPKY